MAERRLYVVSANGTSGTSGSTEVWSVRQGSRSLTICQVSLSLGYSAAASGMLVSLNAYTGTLPGTGAAATPQKWHDLTEAAATATAEINGTSVATIASTGPQWYVQPFGGILDVQYPLQREPGLDAAGTTAMWSLVLTNAAIGYPYAGYVVFEES